MNKAEALATAVKGKSSLLDSQSWTNSYQRKPNSGSYYGKVWQLMSRDIFGFTRAGVLLLASGGRDQ